MKVHFSLLLPFIFATPLFCQSWRNDDQHDMKLELVQVFFRHAERTPLATECVIMHYTDFDVYEPYGLEQLSKNGKVQAYNLGEMLRRRYDGFLNETYKREDIFAQTAEIDRIQTTLQLVLAGLYSSDLQNVEWNPKLNWSPIPINYLPEKLDILFRSFDSNKYRLLLHEAIISTRFAKKIEAFSYLRDHIERKSGITFQGTYDLFPVALVLNIHSRLNISLPTWYTRELRSQLEDLQILAIEIMTSTAELRRILAGPLIKTFIDRMNSMGTARNPRKMYLYSASDLNVDAVARALHVDGFRLVDFAGAMILETLRDVHGQLYVRILEWDAINGTLTSRKLNGCDDVFCRIEDFSKICRDLIPSRKELNCMLDDFQGHDITDLYV